MPVRMSGLLNPVQPPCTISAPQIAIFLPGDILSGSQSWKPSAAAVTVLNALLPLLVPSAPANGNSPSPTSACLMPSAAKPRVPSSSSNGAGPLGAPSPGYGASCSTTEVSAAAAVIEEMLLQERHELQGRAVEDKYR